MRQWQAVPLFLGAAFAALPSPTLGQPDCGLAGERRIYTCVHPGPGPTIVLAAGAGQDSRTWSDIVVELRQSGTVLTFDRPGLGQSPTVDGARTPSAIARGLREILDVLNLSEPAVLVGHSMGGIHLLRFAELFPGSVAAVVLVDTPPPSFETERLKLLTVSEREIRRRVLAEGRASAPEIIGRERDGAAAEGWTFDPLPKGVPLTVIVGDQQDFGELGSQMEHRSLWRELSREWLALASGGDLVVAEGSGHMVHIDRPDVVLEAVRRVIGRGAHRREPN